MFTIEPTRYHGDANNNPGAGGPWASWDNGDRHISVSFGVDRDGFACVKWMALWGPGAPTMQSHRPSPFVLNAAWMWLTGYLPAVAP